MTERKEIHNISPLTTLIFPMQTKKARNNTQYPFIVKTPKCILFQNSPPRPYRRRKNGFLTAQKIQNVKSTIILPKKKAV